MRTDGLLKRIREGRVEPPRNYTAEVDADLNAMAIVNALRSMSTEDDGFQDAWNILADSPAGRRVACG